MATVNKILLPRRGKKSLMETTKASTLLESGELFAEVPDEGVGKGHTRFKIGDGTTVYSDLPYALGDTSNDEITFLDTAETDINVVISKIASGAKLETLIKNIKKAISILKGNDDKLNTSISNLTDSNTIKYVKLVNTLPADAASHPDTVYLIKS